MSCFYYFCFVLFCFVVNPRQWSVCTSHTPWKCHKDGAELAQTLFSVSWILGFTPCFGGTHSPVSFLRRDAREIDFWRSSFSPHTLDGNGIEIRMTFLQKFEDIVTFLAASTVIF